MGKKEKAPCLRFKDTNGKDYPAWEQRKLKDFTLSYSGGTPTVSNKNYYNGTIPFIRSGEISGERTELFITEEGLNKSSAKSVHKGQILYALYGATSGEVSLSKIDGAINQAILAISTKEGYSNAVLSFWLRKEKDRITATFLQGGQGNLSGEIVKNLIVPVPSQLEQTKIGDFFNQLDGIITLHQRKLETLKKLKRTLLQKMFPKKGQLKPELRFPGFTNDWEQRKLGELAATFGYGLNAAAKSFDGRHKYIRITDIDESTRRFLCSSLTSPDIDFEEAAPYRLAEGDVLFARTGASVGKSYRYVRTDGDVYFAGFLIRFRFKDKEAAEFVFQNSLTAKFQNFIKTSSQRSGQPGINAQQFSGYQIAVPNSEERERIGSFFSRLDTAITLHQRKLETYKKLKKSLLQKMFI